LSKRVSLGANPTEDFHPNQLMSFATTLADRPYFHRSIISLSGRVRGPLHR